MGNWSEAVEDGVVCKKYHLPLGDEGEAPSGKPTLCQNCQSENGDGKLGPNWLPPR